VIQASHVSTGTTNNALALNPSGGNVGVGTTTPATTLHIQNSTADATSQLDNAPTSHILLRNTKTGSSPYSMGIGVDQTTGAGYINAAGNGAIQPVCLQTRGGNVGIGTTNPAVALDVVGNIRTTGNITQGSGVFFKNSATATSYMTINGGDAFNSPFLEFVYGGTRRSYIGNATANDVQIACESGAQLSIMTAGSSRMVVLPSGNVGIGTTNPTQTLQVVGPIRSIGTVGVTPSGVAANTMYYWWTATQFAFSVDGSMFYYVSPSSDYRIKENIQSPPPILSRLCAINMIEYEFKTEGVMKNDGKRLGVFAHELQEAFPEYPNIVMGKKDEVNEDGSIKIQSVAGEAIGYLVMKSVQELASQATSQDTLVQELSTQLAATQQQLSEKSAALDALIAWAQTQGYSASV
jgi:hypothetical protein